MRERLHGALDSVVMRGGFILGEEVERFEEEFAAYVEARHCVGVSSGTAALTLGLMAAGIGPGDEVIVPAHTYIASALAVIHAGSTPRLCDVCPGTGLLDVRSASEAIGERTAAIMPVHLYGQVCDMDAVLALARSKGLLVIEDAAQAHGARFRGRRAGSLGDVAAFSFYPSKNLGALGDGGAVCTGDAEIAEHVRRLRHLGQRHKGEHLARGFNERLDGIQAAFLRVKLPDLDRANAARRSRAARYRSLLPLAVETLVEDSRSECVYHLFPVRAWDRDVVAERLAEQGVGSGVHYWPALHRQPPLRHLAPPTDGLRVAEAWSEEELSLPMFPELTDKEVSRVAEVLASAVDEAL